MSVKAEIKVASNTLGYPKIRRSKTGEIVLFITPTSGTIVGYIENLHKIENVGYYSSTWSHNDFTDFDGAITLENNHD